jgi:hypothetical protein
VAALMLLQASGWRGNVGWVCDVVSMVCGVVVGVL